MTRKLSFRQVVSRNPENIVSGLLLSMLLQNVILRRQPKLVLSKAKELMRSFTEPVLSEILQSLRSFRMTEGEGFRMTLHVRFFTSLRFVQNDKQEGFKKIKKNQQSIFLFYMVFTSLLCYAFMFNPPLVSANNIKIEGPILDSAENFFISLKQGNLKTAWELLSEKSHKIIIDDVYTASKEAGIEIKKEDIIKDFNSNGAIFNNYWKAFLNNFNPDIVLKDRIWELEEIKLDYAVILLKKDDVVTELQMYNENSQWKVGFVETFWKGKGMKIINFMSSLLF